MLDSNEEIIISDEEILEAAIQAFGSAVKLAKRVKLTSGYISELLNGKKKMKPSTRVLFELVTDNAILRQQNESYRRKKYR